MKTLVESIKKTEYSEWHDVVCLDNFTVERKTGNITFKKDEKYEASKINDKWWLIDSIGVSSSDFKKYFKDI